MSDQIKKIDTLRSIYNAKSIHANNSMDDELREIKTELKIANDLQSTSNAITNATNSPYLEDQKFYNKEVRYNSERETNWKEVRSEEDNLRAAYNARNLRKLNIL
jgi:hypothetical protein